MAKLSATQQTIAQAFAQYKEGSTAVVRAFETAIHGFWHTDRCRTENLEFFINTAKRFPVLQRTAVAILTKKDEKALGYFEIKKNKEGNYTIRNSAGKDKQGNELPITKEMKVVARQNVAKFIAMEYTSLMHDKDMKFDISFDEKKSATTIRNAIIAQVKAMMAANGDVNKALMTKIIADATTEALNDENMLKAQIEGQKLAKKAAEQKEKAEAAKLAKVA